MMALILLQTATNAASSTAPKVLNAQSLQTMGVALGGGATLSPVFTGIGQLIKQHPKVRNQHLRWILPLLAFAIAIAIIYFEIRGGAQIDALTIFLIIGMFIGAASVGAEALYKTGIMPAGPDNHPLDAAAASSNTITIQTPITTGLTSVLPSNAIITPNTIEIPNQTQNPAQSLTASPVASATSPQLPPSPFHP